MTGVPSGQYDTQAITTTLTTACLNAADPLVDFSQYEGINLNFDFRYAGFALGGPGEPLNLDGQERTWRITWNPPFSWKDQYFISHEIGHSINLPHSGGDPNNTRFVYDNLWDVMSGGGENNKLPDPNGVIGNIGPGTNAYYAYRVGWIAESEVETVATGQTKEIVLEQIILPQATGNKRLIIVPIQGSTNDFYTIEAHFENSYDAAAPATGVVIYRAILNRGQDGIARVVDSDGNANVNDEGATWVAGETFTDAANNISMRVVSKGDSNFTVVVNNNGPENPTTPEPPAEQITWNAPVGNVAGSIGNPTYEWQAVDGATGYQVYVAPKANLAAYSFFGNVPAATYCNEGTCSVDLTDISIGAWLPNGTYQAYICPSSSNCNNASNWTGVNPTIEFTIDTATPTAIATGDFFSNETGTGWNLTGNAANSSWFELYIAPTNNIGAYVYYNWQSRKQVCGAWDSTTCTLPASITNLFANGTQYTIYFRGWGPGGFTTGGIVGWAGPFEFTP